MSLKTKFSLLLVAIFVLFMGAFWGFTQYWVAGINNDWATRLTEKQVLFDKHRTLHPLLREIALAKQMAAEPALLDMALHESDPAVRQRGIALMESYRNKFSSHLYSAVFSQTQHYYLNDEKNAFAGAQLRYTLSPKNPVDAWFYATLASGNDYALNVSMENHGATKVAQVWINVLLKHEGKAVGIVGTGLALDEFLLDSVAMEQAGVTNLFVDSNLAIQLNRDSKMIDLASIAKPDAQRLKVNALFTQETDMASLRAATQRLIKGESSNEMLRVSYRGKPHLLGVAYIPALDWFDLTLIDAQQGVLFAKLWWVAGLFGVLFLSVLALVAWMLHRWLLNPMAILKNAMHELELNHYTSLPPLVGSAEIKSLSQQFNVMAEHIRTHQQELENKVQERTSLLTATLESLPDLWFELSLDGGYRQMPATYKHGMAVDPTLMVGKSVAEVLPAGAAKIVLSGLAEAHLTGRSTGKQFYLDLSDGRFWFELSIARKQVLAGQEPRFIALSRDITERKNAEEKIRQLAFYDALTGVPNRRLLDERLGYAMLEGKRSGHYGALMFLDLDKFKPLNDLHGHEMGDLMLIEVARRLQSCVREVDTVARFGGDEFVVVLGALSGDMAQSETDAGSIAEKIRSALAEPYFLQAQQGAEVVHHSAGSIGVTLFQGQIIKADDLLKRADMAMYQAKQAGRNRVCFQR
ncbi:MAG: diguanylate cyclase [Sideroxydans sp.]|nr:diguanylate cyclase [Sideroxydans sp.]